MAALAIILWMGLWPLDFNPANRVQWLPGGGLQFKPNHSTATKSERLGGVAHTREVLGPLPVTDGPPANGWTLQLDVQPIQISRPGLLRIITVQDTAGRDILQVTQWNTFLLIHWPSSLANPPYRMREISIRNGMTAGLRQRISIVTSLNKTTVWLGTKKVAQRSATRLPGRQSPTGCHLIVGNTFDGKTPWSGNLFYLAIYDRALSPGEIKTQLNHPASGDTDTDSSLLARYSFSEGHGPMAQNDAAGPALHLPDRFPAPPAFLRGPIVPERLDPYTVSDVALNVAGFIPFGGLLAAWLVCGGRRRGTAMLTAIAAGIAVSLTIEWIQGWLPVRDSSLTDLACNSVGGVIGAGIAVGIPWLKCPSRQ